MAVTTTIKAALGLLLGAAVLAQAHTLEPLPAGVSAGQVLVPQGVYAHIDTRQTQEMLQTLTQGSCLLYTSPSPRDKRQSRMPSSA